MHPGSNEGSYLVTHEKLPNESSWKEALYQDSWLEGSAGAKKWMSNWKQRLPQDTPSLMSPTKALIPFIQKKSAMAEKKRRKSTTKRKRTNFSNDIHFSFLVGMVVTVVKLYLRSIGKRMHKYVNCAKVILYKLSHFLFLQRNKWKL